MPNYRCESRVLDNFYLIYTVAGSGRVYMKGKSYRISSGSVFFLFPGVAHSYYTSSDDPLELKWLGFDGAQAFWILTSNELTPDAPVRSLAQARTGRLNKLLDELFTAAERRAHELVLSGLLYQILGDSVLLKAEQSRADREFELGKARMEKPIERALNYMDSNYTRAIRIEDVAYSLMFRDEYYFSRWFHRNVGQSPSAYRDANGRSSVTGQIGRKAPI